MPSSARAEALRGRASRPGTSGHELAGAARAGRRGSRPRAQLPQRDAGGVTTTSPGRGRSDARLLSRRPPPRGRGYRCAGTDRCRAAAFSASSSASSCAEPMCSILRDPRREDQTIWTAVAPDAVFTVRTYATRRDYEPQLSAQIRRLRLANQQLTALRRRRPARASSYRPNDGLRRYMTAASDKDLHGLWRASEDERRGDPHRRPPPQKPSQGGPGPRRRHRHRVDPHRQRHLLAARAHPAMEPHPIQSWLGDTLCEQLLPPAGRQPGS